MILEKLMKIQTSLKAPKNLENTFGHYKYRNAEGILEAVKPYLAEQGLVLVMTDDIEVIGEKYYIKATATLVDIENGDKVETHAYAQEPMEKKGMDPSQITGASSSYARKYCLNALLCLDDTKDADSNEARIESENRAAGVKTSKKASPVEPAAPSEPKLITEAQLKDLSSLAENKGVSEDMICKRYNVSAFNQLKQEDYFRAVKALNVSTKKEDK